MLYDIGLGNKTNERKLDLCYRKFALLKGLDRGVLPELQVCKRTDNTSAVTPSIGRPQFTYYCTIDSAKH